MKRIAFFGSAAGDEGDLQIERKVTEIGRKLGEFYGSDLTVLTGACLGYPDIAASAAREQGARVIGYTGETSLEGHCNKSQRYENYVDPEKLDELILSEDTGLGRNLSQRSLHMANNADIAIFLGGRTGTMTEFGVSYDDFDIPLYRVEGTGGFADGFDKLGFNKARNAVSMKADVDTIVGEITGVSYRMPIMKRIDKGIDRVMENMRIPALFALTFASGAFAVALEPPKYQNIVLSDQEIVRGMDIVGRVHDNCEIASVNLTVGHHHKLHGQRVTSDYTPFGKHNVVIEDANCDFKIDPLDGDRVEINGFPNLSSSQIRESLAILGEEYELRNK